MEYTRPIPFLNFDQRGRFNDKIVEIDGGCWEWVGLFRPGRGGATFKLNKYPYTAARVMAHECFGGEAILGKCVVHTCKNRRCLNPDHFEIAIREDVLQFVSGAKQLGKSYNAGTDNGLAKVTQEMGDAIMSENLPVAQIAKAYNVSKATVWTIRAGKHWTTARG